MSEPITNIIIPVYEEVIRNNPLPINQNQYSQHIVTIMAECESEARRQFRNLSPNQLGRCNGDWFELIVRDTATNVVGNDNLMVFPGRGHHINEIQGFKQVNWIPQPDVIGRNLQDFRAVVSLKWGMRHDRMYEVGYEAYAIKDWVSRNNLPEVQVYLLTNDKFSGRDARLDKMSQVPALDGVFHIQHDNLTQELQQVIGSYPDLLNHLTNTLSN